MSITSLAYWQNMLKSKVPEDTVTDMQQAVEQRVRSAKCASCGAEGTHETQHCWLPVVIKAVSRANPDLGKRWASGKLNKKAADQRKRSYRRMVVQVKAAEQRVVVAQDDIKLTEEDVEAMLLEEEQQVLARAQARALA